MQSTPIMSQFVFLTHIAAMYAIFGGNLISAYCLLPQLKESKKTVNSIRLLDEDDDDEVEKVSWSGEPIGSKCPSI